MIFFRKKNLKEKKAQNLKRAKKSWQKGESRVGHFPLVFYLEPTSVCNLFCPMCPVAMGVSEYQYSEKFLDLNWVDSLLEPLSFALRCFLSGGGEPFLHPRFLELAERVKELGLEVILNTNGTLIDSSLARAIVELELDCLSFSIDAVEEEKYSRLRQGAQLEQVRQAIAYLQGEKRRQGKVKPYINMQFTLYQENYDQLLKVVDFASELGINHLVIEPLSPIFSFDSKYQEFFQAQYLPAENQLLLELKNLQKKAKEKGLIFSSHYLEEKEPINFPCPQPWINFGIRTNGRVFLCCGTAENMGSITEKDFSTLWNGEKYRFVRERVAQDNYPDFCQLCLEEARSPKFNLELIKG